MKRILVILSSMIVLAGTQALWAAPTLRSRVPLLRDETYEQNLRWEASADKTVTPAKVLRWMRGLRGEVLSAPSQTEFQPIFNTQDGRIRFVGAIAYKF